MSRTVVRRTRHPIEISAMAKKLVDAPADGASQWEGESREEVVQSPRPWKPRPAWMVVGAVMIAAGLVMVLFAVSSAVFSPENAVDRWRKHAADQLERGKTARGDSNPQPGDRTRPAMRRGNR
jgi:hypothetical protein